MNYKNNYKRIFKPMPLVLFMIMALVFNNSFILAQEEQEVPKETGDTFESRMEKKIDLDYKDADIASILRSLSWTYGLNIVTSPDVKGKVTISLKEVAVKKALDAILTVNGLAYSIRDGIIYVSPGDTKVVELTSEVIFLNFVKAANAQNILRKIMSSKGEMKIDETANSLIITDYPANIEKLKSLLKKIDIAPRQVLIEAKIVDITSTDLQALGITWDLDYAPGHGIFGRGTQYAESLGTTVTLPEQSSSIDTSTSPIKINTLSLKGITADISIDALVRDGKANLLASPSIAVLNGQEARIVIGERYPYKERTQTTTGTTETTRFVDIGTTLKVTPQINEDGYITMRVHPEVSSLAASLDAGPRITTREADTTVRVKEGETLVIGGLIKKSDDSSLDKVPLLGDIPLLGWLFRRSEKNVEQKELAVFITPRIFRTREEMELLSKEEIKKQEAYIQLTKTGELTIVESLYERAKALETGREVDSVRKEKDFRKTQALSLYEHIYYSFPDSLRAPEALYHAGNIYFSDLKEYKKAKESFAKLISDYPKSSYVKKAKKLYREAEEEEEKNNFSNGK